MVAGRRVPASAAAQLSLGSPIKLDKDSQYCHAALHWAVKHLHAIEYAPYDAAAPDGTTETLLNRDHIANE